MSNTDFDPTAYTEQPPAKPAEGGFNPDDYTAGFNPDQFVDEKARPYPTGHERVKALRERIRQEPPESVAGSSTAAAAPRTEPTSGDELLRMWSEIGKGVPEGIAGAVTGGIAGDVEGAARSILNMSPYLPENPDMPSGRGFSPHTYLPTSTEGGPLLGNRGAGLGVIPPTTDPMRATGRGIGSMMAPGMVAKGVGMVRGVPPPSDLPQVPKFSTPREVQGRRISPDLLPPDADVSMPRTAPAGAQTVSPLKDIAPEAIERVARSLEESGFTPHTLEQRLEEMSQHQFAFEVGGIGGQPWRSARGIVVDGGQGGQDVASAMRQRTAEAPQRIEAIFNDAFGGTEDLSMLRRSIDIDQNKESTPLYNAFRELRISPTPELKELIPRLSAAGAFGTAKKLAALKGIEWNQSFFTPGAQKIFPTAESWDMVKRALDAKIQASYTPQGRPTIWTAQYTELKNKLVNAIDNHPDPKISGVWKQARQTFMDYQLIKNAMDFGRRLLSENIHPNELQFLTAAYSEPEMAAARQGLRDYLFEQAGRPGNTSPQLVKKLLGRNNTANIRWMIHDEKADRLVAALEHEQEMYTSPRDILMNTQTAEKLADRGMWAAQEGVVGKVIPWIRHPIREAMGTALERGSNWANKAAEAKAGKIRDDAARILTMQGPERDAVLKWILDNYVGQKSPTGFARGGRVRGKRRQGGGRTNDDGDTSDSGEWGQYTDPETGVPHITIPARTRAREDESPAPSPDSGPTQETSPELPEQEYTDFSGGPTPQQRGFLNKLLGIGGSRYQTWPERMVRSGATLAHDVMTGEEPVIDPETGHTSERVIQRAQDMSALAGTGGLAGAEPGAAGVFAGKLAKGADLQMLAKAKQMWREDVDPTQIYRSTGWFQGKDGHWRFEIPDINMQVSRKGIVHPDLAKAYPQFKNVETKVGPFSQEAFGAFTPELPAVDYGAFKVPKEPAEITVLGPKETWRDTAAHEAQHFVQHQEGFQPGGNPTSSQFVNRKDPYRAYWRTAGETEARNVGRRAASNFTPEQSRSIPPWKTQDVPYSRQTLPKERKPIWEASQSVTGKTATGADLRSLNKAKSMVEKGASTKDIYDKTGWQRDSMGMWSKQAPGTNLQGWKMVASGQYAHPSGWKIQRGDTGWNVLHPDTGKPFDTLPTLPDALRKYGNVL